MATVAPGHYVLLMCGWDFATSPSSQRAISTFATLKYVSYEAVGAVYLDVEGIADFLV
ncbi:hypothetical protein KIN20_037755 [Parelaphostrongylus tenuis]|uniref:Uncharacterized protein n=1 Tax=Parelaphostrongylus tenuis TaxID=148309 RepID=A0AAD5REP9_PARTN|nr:hypothetical protein KIN20_037755 [Parelaphostrongylus tenuis]